MVNQITINLNMMRTSRVNPKISTHTNLFGEFNDNMMPLSLLVTKVVTQKNKEKRLPWYLHRTIDWYIQLNIEHYMWHPKVVTKTGAEQISGTMNFYPKFLNYLILMLSTQPSTGWKPWSKPSKRHNNIHPLT